MNMDGLKNFRKNFRPLSARSSEFVKPGSGEIFDLVPDGVVGCNSKGNIVHWDDRAEHIFGWKAKEVHGKAIAEVLIPTEFRALHTNGMKRMVETGESRVVDKFLDLTAIHKKGHRLPIEMVIKQISSGKQIFFYSFIRENVQKSNLKKKMDSYELMNKILRLALRVSKENGETEAFVKSTLETLGKYFNSSLAFAFEMDEDFYNLLPAIYNQTGLNKEDLVRPILEEIKLLPHKKLLIDSDEIQWSQSIQEDRESPFYDFAKSFGFHGWVNVPLPIRKSKKYCFSFFSPSKRSVHPMELKMISEIQADLTNCI